MQNFVLKMSLTIFWKLTTIMSVLLISGTVNGQTNLNYCTSKDAIDYLINLITKTQEEEPTYQFPKNASQYSAEDGDVLDYGTFDFIIIGAGSAGTVIANRLTEISNWKVLLLEAGDYGDCLTNIPSMFTSSHFTKYNWGFYSTPQKTSCLGMVENRCPITRGKGVGGSTLINALLYSRGSSIDFDRWAKHVNDSLWSYDVVLDYFKKSEKFTHRDKTAPVYEPAHGMDGYLHVEYYLPRSPQLAAFLEANKELGLSIADYNANTGLGASPLQLNTRNGTRFDGGRAFIRPVLNRKNLVVLTNAYATKIKIHKLTKIAYGVAFNHKNQKYFATVNKEVIVSAGAIGSPHLLLLSGIGPKRHLKAVHVPLVKNLEVGSGLKDHPTFYGLNFGTNYTEPIKPFRDYLEEFTKGHGQLAAAGASPGVGFYESQFTKDTGYPDIELVFLPSNVTSDISQRDFNLKDSTYEDVWKNINRSQSFIMFVVALHAVSLGTVRLKNNDPLEYPIINTNLLSDLQDKDISTIYEGIQLALKLTGTHAFKKLDTKLQGGPLRACKRYEYQSKRYWYCAIRQITMDLYHPISTCPMGQFPKKGDVVNSKLQVHGVRKLRVADASVIPFSLAGHPNAPVVMIGEILSDLLKKDYLP